MVEQVSPPQKLNLCRVFRNTGRSGADLFIVEVNTDDLAGFFSRLRTHPSVAPSLPLEPRQTLANKRHYLTASRRLLFHHLTISLLKFLSVHVNVGPQGTAKWTLRSSWQYWGPSCCHLTTEKVSWATPLTTSSGRWESKPLGVSLSVLRPSFLAPILKHRPSFCRDSAQA